MNAKSRTSLLIFALILGITRLWVVFFIVLALLIWTVGPALIRFSGGRR